MSYLVRAAPAGLHLGSPASHPTHEPRPLPNNFNTNQSIPQNTADADKPLAAANDPAPSRDSNEPCGGCRVRERGTCRRPRSCELPPHRGQPAAIIRCPFAVRDPTPAAPRGATSSAHFHTLESTNRNRHRRLHYHRSASQQ